MLIFFFFLNGGFVLMLGKQTKGQTEFLIEFPCNSVQGFWLAVTFWGSYLFSVILELRKVRLREYYVTWPWWHRQWGAGSRFQNITVLFPGWASPDRSGWRWWAVMSSGWWPRPSSMPWCRDSQGHMWLLHPVSLGPCCRKRKYNRLRLGSKFRFQKDIE